MFNFIKNTLQKIYSQFSAKLGSLFSKSTIDEATLKELEIILLSSDTGVKTTQKIIETVRKNNINKGEDLYYSLQSILLKTLTDLPKQKDTCSVFLLVGINGSGKTTFTAKLAHSFTKQGKKVLLVAADTFRVAAPEQLKAWADQIGTDIELGQPNQDPASVVFKGCERFITEQYDILIIDTAGRLQTKTNLMHELEKIKRTINKKITNLEIQTLLTIDSLIGQNSLEQAKLFLECTQVNGIVLTKMDGTGKGGIVFAIATELNIPVRYITFGEQLDQLKVFDPKEYVKELLDTV